MKPRAVVLFSGGLDSILAAAILQKQGLEVDGLNVKTVFHSCEKPARSAADALGINLTVVSAGEAYVELLRHPRYGYGKGINPCIDCRIYMCKLAKRFMEEREACVVATGEVLSQRPMSQKRNHLDCVDRRSGLHGRLLRPLSAKLLEPTIPETEGIIDRDQLYRFSGRGRTPLIQLANELGVTATPQPSTGCAITETTFAPRVRDVLDHGPEASLWDLSLLVQGRHIRLDDQTKVAIGRNQNENQQLLELFDQEMARNATVVQLETEVGPTALLIGQPTEANLKRTGALVVRYATKVDREKVEEIAIEAISQEGSQKIFHVSAEDLDTVQDLKPA